MPDKRFLRKLETVAEVVIEGYRNGMTLTELSEMHSCAPGTVRNILIAHREPRRKRGARKLEDKEINSV